jgi:hypothetical protein
MQVFVDNMVDDGMGGLTNELDLAFGKHIEACDAGARPSPDPLNGTADTLCNSVGNGTVSAAMLTMGEIRIVFDELLDGNTAEQFECACNVANSGGGMADCGAGPTYAVDPSTCPENPNTSTKEQGRWADVEGNGIPDSAELLPGLVTVTCGAMTFPSQETDGLYNPSGNQLVPVASGLAQGLGPALSITGLTTGNPPTPVTLPADTDCTITLSSSLKDKDGNAVVFHSWDGNAAPTSVTFHTALM